MEITIRTYRPKDAQGLAELFWESVRYGTGAHYTAEERIAWAPVIPDTDVWNARLSAMTTLVAEDSVGLSGFMTLEPNGHIDLAYVRSDLIGKGVAAKLYAEIEAMAHERGTRILFSEASHLAKPFFERNGWSVIETQQVKSAGGLLVTNHRMKKDLVKD